MSDPTRFSFPKLEMPKPVKPSFEKEAALLPSEVWDVLPFAFQMPNRTVGLRGADIVLPTPDPAHCAHHIQEYAKALIQAKAGQMAVMLARTEKHKDFRILVAGHWLVPGLQWVNAPVVEMLNQNINAAFRQWRDSLAQGMTYP